MLPILLGLCIVILLIGVYEYFTHWRPRADQLADNFNKPLEQLREPVVGIVEDVHGMTSAARRVAETASDALCRWIEGHATAAEQRLGALETQVASLGHVQAMGFARKLRRGFEALRRFEASRDRHLLERARDDLRDGFTDLALYFGTVSGLRMLETAASTGQLLTMAGLAAETELRVLSVLGCGAELEAARRCHSRIANDVRDRLATVGNVSRVVLPPSVRAACGGNVGGTRRNLEQVAGRIGNSRAVAELNSDATLIRDFG